MWLYNFTVENTFGIVLVVKLPNDGFGRPF